MRNQRAKPSSMGVTRLGSDSMTPAAVPRCTRSLQFTRYFTIESSWWCSGAAQIIHGFPYA